MAKKKQAPEMKLFITQSGGLFSEDDLKKYEIPQTNQIISEVKWGAEALPPPYDLSKLMAWLESNVTHNSCIRQKVQDSVGIGWHLEDVLDVESPDKEKKTLAEFFNKVNESEDIINVCKKVFLDYEACGNSYIEVVRGTASDPNSRAIKALYHVNATFVRWVNTYDKYLQQIGAKKVYFKLFGDERVMNKNTGKFESVSTPEDIANELIQIKQYTPRSYWYGLPEWLPALLAMYGSMKEQEYNLDFFTNYGVPAYAVVLSGITVKPEVEDSIKKYFETEVKANPHKTMVFGLPQGGEVRFEKLSVETKEASFRIYRRDNRDDILTAHHVPPYRVGIVQQGQLGGTIAGDVDRIYLDSVINPRQRDFEWLINQLIVKEAFGIMGWAFRFNDIDIDDRTKMSDIDSKYLSIGVLTPNEIRKRIGLATYTGGDTFYMMGNLIPVGGEATAIEVPIEEGKADIKDYISDLEIEYDEKSQPIEDYVNYLGQLIEKKGHYRARAMEPSKFREKTLALVPLSVEEGITAVVGKLKAEGEVKIQMFLFEKTKWTTEKIQEWLKEHKVKVVLFEEA